MKLLIILSSVALVVGLLLCTVGIALNGFDFAKLETEQFTERTYQPSGDFDAILVDSETASVRFLPSEDGKCRVVCHESAKQVYDVSVVGNTLAIRYADNRQWFEKLGISVAARDLTVYLPQTEYASLTVHSTTGSVEVGSAFRIQKASIDLTTGSIRWEAQCSEELDFNTTPGSITRTNAAPRRLSLSAVTGRITLRDVIAAEELRLSTTTGGIHMERCDAPALHIRTTTGSVYGSLLSNKKFIASSTTGSIRVPQDGEGGICDVATTTGSIHFERASGDPQ